MESSPEPDGDPVTVPSSLCIICIAMSRGASGSKFTAEFESSSLQVDRGNGTSNFKVVGVVGEATFSSCSSDEVIDSVDDR